MNCPPLPRLIGYDVGRIGKKMKTFTFRHSQIEAESKSNALAKAAI